MNITVAQMEVLAARAVNRFKGRFPQGITLEDALQESLVEIIRWKDKPVPPGANQESFLVMKAWGTLKDKFGRMWRDEYAMHPNAEREHPEPKDVPINPVEPKRPVKTGIEEDDRPTRELQMDVRAAVARLDPRARAIMTGILDGKTHAEIAIDLGLSQPWVSRIAREAQNQLRALLKAYDDE